MGEAKRKKAAANIPSPVDNDRRRINDDLVMVYQEGLSEAYRCASVEAAKAIHNSGLSHKEQLDLVINVLHNLMTHSPNGYAAELEALDKHLKKMPHNYLEDVELYINRQMKNHPDSRAKISSDRFLRLI